MRDEGIKRLLREVHPLEDDNRMYRDFQKKKMKIIGVTLIAGVASAFGIHLCSRMNTEFAEGAFLTRKEWDEEDYQITLQAEMQNQVYEFPVQVKTRKLTKQEKQNMLQDLQTLLPQLIKKDNSDLKKVTGDLYLPSSIQGYPFVIIWSSSNEERISKSGRVNRQDMTEKDRLVVLSATISDEAIKEVFTYEIYLLPEKLSEEERLQDQLWKRLQEADEKSVFQKEIWLPEAVEGKEIRWKKTGEDESIWILLLTFAGSICISRGMEYELKQKAKKRNQQLLLDYPDFVSRLRLYLSAGLTVKSAFCRIAKELQKNGYLQKEMQIACHRLENGVPEAAVYQEWGNRCKEAHYRRLSFLMSVHLKQGNGKLLTMLTQEAVHAQEERRSQARKAGEEASTKLLAPMMLMLIVVMFLILLPAYLDFGGL